MASKKCWADSPTITLSSTTSTRPNCGNVWDTEAGFFTVFKGTVNQKQLPTPGVLCTPISPSIKRHSCLQMAKPRPDPSWPRVEDGSAWVNESKMLAIAVSDTPMPLSMTSKRNVPLSPNAPTVVTRMATSPCSVNFTALPTRLSSTWRTRRKSPRKQGGTSGATT